MTLLLLLSTTGCLGCGFALWAARNRFSLRLQVTFLALYTSLSSILAVGLLACWASNEALVNQQRESLSGLQQARAHRVEDYLQTIEAEVVSFSANLLIAEAARDFGAAFDRVETEAEKNEGAMDGPAARAMAAYFEGPYRQGLTANNQPFRGAAAYQVRSPAGRILQAEYIANNPHPVGEKLNLNAGARETAYNRAHARYHPSIRNHLKSFGFYDVFLFNSAGDLVYSVFKETDFATNLLHGPYAQTSLGSVVAECLEARSPDVFTIRDFAEYEPSYGAPASFVGSPIFLDGERIGAAVFQVPVEQINNVVLAAEGLGESGLAYFVGDDRMMRSVARDESLADALMTGPMETEAITRATQGETGSVSAIGILGEPTLATFGPLDIAGLKWNIIVEVPMEQVLRPSRALAATILLLAALLAVPVVIYALFMAHAVIAPVRQLTETMKDFAEGDADLTQRVDESRKDELGELGRWFNRFVLRIHDLVAEAVAATRSVELAAVSIEGHLGRMSSGLEEQRAQTSAVVSRVSEFAASAGSVASRASDVRESAGVAGKKAEGGRSVVNRTVETIESIARVVTGSASAVEALRSRAEEIGAVIDVINDVADQTNLLALNAAIEAARAGEHGRGFAVVADEVRKLAERTTRATEEVAESIRAIQTQTSGAVEGMRSGKERVEECIGCATEAGDALLAIVEGSRQVAELIREMAEATEKQTAAADEMSQNLDSIALVTQRSADGAVDVVTSAKTLRSTSESLSRLMSAFKVSDRGADTPVASTETLS